MFPSRSFKESESAWLSNLEVRLVDDVVCGRVLVVSV